jgi:hypothetical protein
MEISKRERERGARRPCEPAEREREREREREYLESAAMEIWCFRHQLKDEVTHGLPPLHARAQPP